MNYNQFYSSMVTDLVADIFYTNTSKRTKLILMRVFSEVIIRKLLKINPRSKMTLGDERIKKKLKKLDKTYKLDGYIFNLVEFFRIEGNRKTHTQFIETKEEEIDFYQNKFYELMSLLFLLYFLKNSHVFTNTPKNEYIELTAVSLLPPIVRLFLWEKLYNLNNLNIRIIDKLVLSKLKSYNKKVATEWVEENKNHLQNISTTDEKSIVIDGDKFTNMYDYCIDKIDATHRQRSEKKCAIYSSFEDAKAIYQKQIMVYKKERPELYKNTAELFELISFCFLGRKENYS